MAEKRYWLELRWKRRLQLGRWQELIPKEYVEFWVLVFWFEKVWPPPSLGVAMIDRAPMSGWLKCLQNHPSRHHHSSNGSSLIVFFTKGVFHKRWHLYSVLYSSLMMQQWVLIHFCTGFIINSCLKLSVCLLALPGALNAVMHHNLLRCSFCPEKILCCFLSVLLPYPYPEELDSV